MQKCVDDGRVTQAPPPAPLSVSSQEACAEGSPSQRAPWLQSPQAGRGGGGRGGGRGGGGAGRGRGQRAGGWVAAQSSTTSAAGFDSFESTTLGDPAGHSTFLTSDTQPTDLRDATAPSTPGVGLSVEATQDSSNPFANWDATDRRMANRLRTQDAESESNSGYGTARRRRDRQRRERAFAPSSHDSAGDQRGTPPATSGDSACSSAQRTSQFRVGSGQKSWQGHDDVQQSDIQRIDMATFVGAQPFVPKSVDERQLVLGVAEHVTIAGVQ